MEHSIDLQQVLETLKKQVADEKQKLDYILKGAELLAQMLSEATKQHEAAARQNIEYSEPGLETAPGTGERHTI